MRLLSLPDPAAVSRAARPVGVCFVMDRLSRAGTESQLLALLRHLDRDRVRPSLCLLNGSEANSRRLQPIGCPTLDLRLRRLASPGTPAAAARLAAFWRLHRVDVVQTYFLDSTYFAVPLARICGIRNVVRVRNNTGYWLTPRHRLLGRIVGRLAPVTLTNSEGARQSVIAADRLRPDRVRVIENGVDLGRFPNLGEPNTGRSVVRIGAVANLRPVKNIDGLIRVAADICRDDGRVRFEVAGEGDQRTGLEMQARAAGLAGRFVLSGSVADVPTFLGTLDIAVLPSHSESMSNALLEYMAAGRAIVATDVGSNAAVARNGREGLIVAAGDDRALGTAIRRFLADPSLARRLGAAARRRVEAEFDFGTTVRRFETFYESLVMKLPAAGPRAHGASGPDS
jgi:glycosyltransferase involved in cell wall biosynthesis